MFETCAMLKRDLKSVTGRRTMFIPPVNCLEVNHNGREMEKRIATFVRSSPAIGPSFARFEPFLTIGFHSSLFE